MAVKSLDSVLRYLHRATGLGDADALTDGQLLQRFVGGQDQVAFELLVRRHGPLVWGVCRRMLHGTHDAEDAFQATFLVLVRRAGVLEPRPSLAGWLYGVACRVACNASRGRARLARRFTQDQDIADLPEATMADEADRGELRVVLDAELSQLPEKYREPLVLCYLEGKTNEQAARELGCPAGSMSKVLARGRELLRERLSRRGVALSAAALGVMLARNAVAAPPGAVVDVTVRAAGLVLGKGTTIGLASEPVSQLTEGVLRAMVFSGVKGMALAAAASVALAAGLSVVLAQQSAAPKAPPVAAALEGGPERSAPPEQLSPAQLHQLHRMLRPRPGEAPWLDGGIPWEANLAEARCRAAREGKPILIWTVGGAGYRDALGRC